LTECEIKCEKDACKMFRRQQCPGTVQSCGQSVRRDKVCPIHVNGWCRPASTRLVRNKRIPVRAFCVAEYTRRCL
jgi:hypothetical protein